MTEKKTPFHYVEPSETVRQATTGVSLHCHTLHSKEILDFVPYYAERIPVLSAFWRYKVRQFEREYGRRPNFLKGYWTPPLAPAEVFESEAESIEKLGLMPIVSITDHDSIAASFELADHVPPRFAPVSMEWTVPFGEAFFHIGVHNLPGHDAERIAIELLTYTYATRPDDRRLAELLKMLGEMPEVLVVLNHPIWDIEMIGQQEHERALRSFLLRHGTFIHALEINGFRSRAENEAVAELAAACGLPLVSGGDRHCCQANTLINITNAGSFDEFVAEIRTDKHSQIAVLPEYHTPLPTRQLRSIAQILGTFPDMPDGRRDWADRIFFDAEDTLGPRPLTEHWGGRVPLWTRFAMLAVAGLGQGLVAPLIALTVGDNDIGRDETQRVVPGDPDGVAFPDVPAISKGKAMAAGQ